MGLESLKGRRDRKKLKWWYKVIVILRSTAARDLWSNTIPSLRVPRLTGMVFNYKFMAAVML